jgi:hypothetical protein
MSTTISAKEFVLQYIKDAYSTYKGEVNEWHIYADSFAGFLLGHGKHIESAWISAKGFIKNK